MSVHSAGILMHRTKDGVPELFLVHPGGPFWAKKDMHAWSIPKGEVAASEDPLAAARREFQEETGIVAEGPFAPLGEVQVPSGKIVHAWAMPGDCDPAGIRSNMFSMEWPPKTGRMMQFPEIDRAAWVDARAAPQKLHRGQAVFVERLLALLTQKTDSPGT
jgi:predicted NUDIX family NTP pyrophosphohydrolase